MPETASKEFNMTVTNCLSRENLKSYLAGWTDESQHDEIEAHIADCEACEQTVVALESDPDTLIEFVRVGSPAAEEQSVLQSAMSKAREIGGDLAKSSVTPASWQPQSKDIGAYELLRPLGHGGMASVYLARHRQLGKQVAIKLLPSYSFRNEYFAARFQREIRAAGGLEHPSIVQATDAGEHNGTHYLVMEHIDGLDVSRIAKLAGKLTIADACEVIRQVALGLSHAHAEGIVHRDVKPSNVMISSSGEAKILDFGLARIAPWDEMSAELTSVGQLMGTLDYMAPEQAERAESVDYRADLYALGATLFKLLCGRPPLAASPDLSPLAKLRLLASKQRPPQLHTIRQDAPAQLSTLLEQLLAYNADDRPASAAHVAEQLAPLCQGSNLKELVSKSVEQAALHEEQASMQSLVTSPLLAEPETLANSQLRSKSGSSWTRRLIQFALLGAAIFAGVLIVLDTQKGQVLIESDAAVQVELRRDGIVAKEIQVLPGTNTTRVFAGKYEVVISEGSDGVSLKSDQLTVTRRDVAVAKIVTNSNSSSMQGIAEATVPPTPDLSAPLKPGDAVRIQSLTDETLHGRAVLAADSTVRFPLIGTVDASNQTIEELRASLEKAYKQFVVSPAIDVFPDMELWQQVGVPASDTETLQPGDRLLVSSISDSTITDFPAIVGRDYKIIVPLIGSVNVKDRTLSDCQDLLEREYKSILVSPNIQVLRDFAVLAARSPVSQRSGSLTAVLPGGNEETTTASNGPVYDGKPLADWLQILEVERSPKALGEAFTAVRSLVTEDTTEQITNLLLRLVPKLDGGMKVTRERLQQLPTGGMGPAVDESSLDTEAFSILRAANKDNYGELIAKELKDGDDEWRERIIDFLYLVYDDQRKPIYDWLTGFLQSVETSSDLVIQVAQYCRGVAAYSEDKALAKELLDAVKNCEALDAEFWLDGSILDQSQFNPDQVSFVAQQAVDQILKGSSPRLIAQASIILAEHPDWISEETKATFQQQLVKLIKAAYKEHGSQLVDVTREFDSYIAPRRVSTRSSRRSSFGGFDPRNPSMLSISIEGYQTSPTIKLLDLAAALQLDIYDSIQPIAAENQSGWEHTQQFKEGKQVEIRWPSLKVTNIQSRLSRGGGRSSSTRTSQSFRTPTPTEWMQYFLVDALEALKPAEEEGEPEPEPNGRVSNSRAANTVGGMTSSQLAQLLGRNSNGRSSTASRSSRTPTNILFRGRSLLDWLKIVPLERSPEGISEALQAIYSLTEEKTGDYIWERLTIILPQVTWGDKAYKSAKSPYAAAFRIMRKAKPNKFYDYVLKQLEEESEAAWKELILRYAVPADVDLETFGGVLDWIKANALADKNNFTLEAAVLIREIVDYAPRTAEDRKLLLSAMSDSKALKTDFDYWMTSLYTTDPRIKISPINKPSNVLAYQQLVAEKAMLVLEEQADVALRIMAIKTLASIQEKSPLLLDREQLSKLVRMRILELSETSMEEILNTVEAPYPFSHFPRNPYSRYTGQMLPTSRTVRSDVATSELYLLLDNVSTALTNSRDNPLLEATEWKNDGAMQSALVAICSKLLPSAGKVEAEICRDLWADTGAIGQKFRSDLGTIRTSWQGNLSARPVGSLNFTELDLLAYYIFQMCRLHMDEENTVNLADQLKTDAQNRFVNNKFDSADQDGNERVSIAEYNKYGERSGKYFSMSPEIADRNGDKSVSKDEIRWLCDNFENIQRYERWATMKPGVESLRTTKDERSLLEWTELINAGLSEYEALVGTDSAIKWAERQIEKYDRDGDGVLTVKEWEKMLIPPKGADLNNDGELTAYEYAEYRSKTKK